MKSNTTLEALKQFTIPASAVRDPQEFFVSRNGLYVSSDFRERILDKAKVINPAQGANLTSYELKERADDQKIEANLPESHFFSESQVCAVIAELISRQSKGEEGILQNNGYSNLFYTASFVVYVYWDSYSGKWCVGAWPRHGRAWYSGGRVFSPAADLARTSQPETIDIDAEFKRILENNKNYSHAPTAAAILTLAKVIQNVYHARPESLGR